MSTPFRSFSLAESSFCPSMRLEGRDGRDTSDASDSSLGVARNAPRNSLRAVENGEVEDTFGGESAPGPCLATTMGRSIVGESVDPSVRTVSADSKLSESAEKLRQRSELLRSINVHLRALARSADDPTSFQSSLAQITIRLEQARPVFLSLWPKVFVRTQWSERGGYWLDLPLAFFLHHEEILSAPPDQAEEGVEAMAGAGRASLYTELVEHLDRVVTRPGGGRLAIKSFASRVPWRVTGGSMMAGRWGREWRTQQETEASDASDGEDEGE